MRNDEPVSSLVARGGHALARAVQLAAGMSGIFLTGLTPLRVAVSGAALLGWVALAAFDVRLSPSAALWVFAGVLVARYLILFKSFGERGLAAWLKERCGRERGFAWYEALSALVFFLYTLSFLWLIEATSVTLAEPRATWVGALGGVLLGLGVIVSVWATSSIGLGNYYYRDLFMGPRHLDFVYAGPYRVLSHPLYGFGQLAAYGAALLASSPTGVLAAALNQAALLVFNALVELPHLRAAARVSVDAELRDRLARTVTELQGTYAAFGGPVDWTVAPNTKPQAAVQRREG